ncbi:calcium-binding protein [Oleomonas cavernae]|nr:calcium-binding protein [Oleomonas cavernae]
MATFSVLNGTGLNGAGVDFGTLNQISASGIAGFPVITPTTGSVFFNDTGLLSLTGTGMSFVFPSTFGGTVNSLTYAKPAVTPVFSITGISQPLAGAAGALLGGGDLTAFLASAFAGVDTISGSSVNDVLAGFGGADLIDGGLGNDIADYGASAAGLTGDLSAGTVSGGDATGDTLTSIEGLTGTAFSDALTGSAAANVLSGGNDNDTLTGLAGADTLNGGNGIDTADYSLSAAGIVIKLAAGTGSGGDAAGDTLSGIETVVGTAFRDAMAGDGNTNTLNGGAGTDVLAGGGGADTLDGGDGIDIVSYAASLAGVQVDLKNNTYTGGDAAGDSLVGIEYLTGSGFGDTLAGTDSTNRLLGLDGDDVLQGNGGNDALRGGAGVTS